MNLFERGLRLALSRFSKCFGRNGYTEIQKWVYRSGTSDHSEHNSNPNYWGHLLAPVLKQPDSWSGKSALDFGCGAGRNVSNLLGVAKWKNVDGIDLSKENIRRCKERFRHTASRFFVADGTSLKPISDEEYDLVISTITLQHIPVFTIRDQIMKDIHRVLKPGGIFSFQMGFGERLDPNSKNGRAKYKEDVFSALGTNSEFDVEVSHVNQVKDHLLEIGFTDVESVVTSSWSDVNHQKWIWTTARK